MRYMIHLIGMPILLLLTALAILTLSSKLVVHQQEMELAQFLYFGSGLLGMIAVVVQVYNFYRVWQASQGIGLVCQLCDKPVSKKNGPNGPYLHCWQCGHNHSITE